MTTSSPDPEEAEAARRYVAKKTTDTDDEMEILCALGLM